MDGLQIYMDKNGVARVYDDTYDITIHCENAEEQEAARRIMNRLSPNNSMDDFEEGELVIYQNGDSFEVGRIKCMNERVAFVYYHEGSTAAATPYDHLHRIKNAYTIKDTLGRCECDE